MINAASPLFVQQGLLPERLYSDAFEYAPDTLKALQSA